MNTLERVVLQTEQQLSGFGVFFENRWDHGLALAALENRALGPYGGSLRPRFDAWALKKLAGARRAIAVHRLVLWFLWLPAAKKPPSYTEVLRAGPASGLWGRLAQKLARQLMEGRHARRQEKR